jgi:uncharacterized protein (DUF1810 family)
MFEHFLEAQEPIYDQVRAELRAGCKTSHWMWFVFPQLGVLGRSLTAKAFGLADLEEARAYAAHPVLGARLRECAALANGVKQRSAEDVFGPIDALKFRSCLTLFWRATGEDVFREGLARYYDGEEDLLTLAAL